MAGKQAKTTQKPTDTTPLQHKSPTTAKNTPMAKKTATTTPPMKQTPKVVQVDKTLTNHDKDEEMTDNASTAMQHIMNALTMGTQKRNNTNKKQQPNKTIFNLWKTVSAGKTGNSINQGATGMMTKDPSLKLHCQIKWWNQATGKGAKEVHYQKILSILEQIQKIDATTAVYQFYSMDKNTPTQLYPPLQGKVKLTTRPSRDVPILPRATPARTTRLHIN